MASRRCRTVNDYHNPRALRKALQSVEEEKSLCDDSVEEDSSSHNSDQQQQQQQQNTPTTLTVKNATGNEEVLDENWDWVLTNYDVGTTKPQSISQELHRLQVLKSYLILDADREQTFDRLTTMASRVFQVPIALVSLVDLGRQWFMSAVGLGDVRETPRSMAFCAHAIQGMNDVLVVPETLEDPRFCNGPLVIGPPYIRFYAGAPLLSPEGYKLGTFCIIDSKPHPEGLSPEDQENLKDFSAMAMKAMVDRRQIAAQDDTAHLVACTAHDLLTPLMGVQLSLSLLQEDADTFAEVHRESLTSAIRSSDWLHRICQTTMETLRENSAIASGVNNHSRSNKSQQCPILNLNNTNNNVQLGCTGEVPECTCENKNNCKQMFQDEEAWPMASPFIDMKEFVTSLNHTMESIPKRVPLILTVDDNVPARIVSDDLKLFRSALNLLSNAFANTQSGSVRFHIRAEQAQPFLVFECIDTGRDLEVHTEADRECLFKPCKKTFGVVKDLGLYSVAYQIDSLGGSYGYRSRAEGEGNGRHGSIFWFRIPIVLPEDISISVAPHAGISADGDLEGTLNYSEKHFPAARFPSYVELSGLAGNSPNHRIMPTGSTASDHQSIRSGILAVAAAAASATSVRTSSSCCGLMELSKFPDIESYKAHQRGMRSRSNSFSSCNSLGACPPLFSGGIFPINNNTDTGNNSSNEGPATAALNANSHNQTINGHHHARIPSTGDAAVDALLATMEKNMILTQRVPSMAAPFRRSHTEPVTASHVRRARRRARTENTGASGDEGPGRTKTETASANDEPVPKMTVIESDTAAVNEYGGASGLQENPPGENKQPLFQLPQTQQPSLFQLPQTQQPSLFQLPQTQQPSLFQLPQTQQPPQTQQQPLFQLPLALPSSVEVQPSLLPLKGPENQVPQQQEAGPRVKKALVIEDTLVVRKTLTRALQKRGYEVSQANDGVEGLDALKKTIFDITLCDFLMPNMDGLDCVQQYRQWEKVNRPIQQYIVGISAHVSQKDIEKGLEIGMNDFRPKPITMKTLQELDESKEMEQVRSVLAKRHEEGDTDAASPMQEAASGAAITNPTVSSSDQSPSATPQGRSCLMASARSAEESGATAKKMRNAGWEVTIVQSGPSALEHLKSRNWGAVILDDDLPGLSGNECVEEFRAWESQNRVNRQDNMFIVCTDVLLANPETCMLPPAGFDGAVDRQVNWNHIQSLMAKQNKPCQPSGLRQGLNIVTR